MHDAAPSLGHVLPRHVRESRANVSAEPLRRLAQHGEVPKHLVVQCPVRAKSPARLLAEGHELLGRIEHIVENEGLVTPARHGLPPRSHAA